MQALHRWKPTTSDLDLVAADIWPDGKVPRLQQAKSTAKRPPALTYQGTHALETASEPFWKISFEVDRLTDAALKGFAFETRKRAETDQYPVLFRALAEMADQRLELLRRHRSGKGTWFGFVEVMKWDLERHSCEVVDVYHERCEGKDAAVEAARRLLLAHIDRMTGEVTIEANVETDLEWEQSARLSVGN